MRTAINGVGLLSGQTDVHTPMVNLAALLGFAVGIEADAEVLFTDTKTK
jgi:hypothetical protein